MENKLASLQKDYEAAINDRAAAHAIIKEYEEVRKPFDDDHLKKKCDGQKNKKIGKLSKQKQKSRRKSGESPSVVPKSEQSSSEKAPSSIKPTSSLDSNYNVKVSNLFAPLSDSEECVSLSKAKPPSSPSVRDKQPCAPAVTASSDPTLSPNTPLRTPPSSPSFCDEAPHIPAVTASPSSLSPLTPSGTPHKQERVNPVMVFEGKPVSTEFACKKIKEAFEEINNRFKT